MVAADLVVRPPVGRPQVERVVGLHIVLQPERDADEAAGALAGVGPWRTSDLRLDHAVAEVARLDDGELLGQALLHGLLLFRRRHRLEPPGNVLGQLDAQALAALPRHRRGAHVVQAKAGARVERKGRGLRRGPSRQQHRSGDYGECACARAHHSSLARRLVPSTS